MESRQKLHKFKALSIMKTLLITSALTGPLIPTAAFAHTDEYLDTLSAPNGGQLRMAGMYHFELVVTHDNQQAKENPILIYVTNHADEKISTSGSKGTVTITAGETKKTINLMPHGDNALKGSGVYAATSDMEVVASVTMPGMPTKHARFTPLAKSVELQKSKHAGHAGHAGH